MSSYAQLTQEKKTAIAALHEEGCSTRHIAKRVSCNQSTVSRFLSKLKNTGSASRKQGTGRKRVSTTQQDRVLKRLFLKNRSASSLELKREWEERTGVVASAVTVRRRLLRNRRPKKNKNKNKKKLLLTENMKKLRLNWCEEHVEWTPEQWKSVIFSDERRFILRAADGTESVGQGGDPDCLEVRFPTSQLIWGCITYHGVGRLQFVDGSLNASGYLAILEEKLLPTIKDHFTLTNNCIFQKDSAPCHRATSVKKWLEERSIMTLRWPGNSPDLNPMENCWHLLASAVDRKRPKTLHELQEAIVYVWNNELSPDYPQKLILSMPQRCAAVIRARGGPIKFVPA